MFDIMSYFKRSNVDILQRAIRKNMMIAFNHGEEILHDRMFGQKAILMVDQYETPKAPPPEPGEPIPFEPKIKIQHNTTSNKAYVFFDKEFFESLEEAEADEMIYQLYNQTTFNVTSQFELDLPKLDGTFEQVPVDILADAFSAEEEEEKKEVESSKGSCDSESAGKAAKEDASKMAEEAAKQTTIKVKDMEESEKLKHPRFKAGNASFNKGNGTSNAKVFTRSSAKKISDKDIKKIAEVEEILEHALKGVDGGKSRTITPSKRLNMKAIITESSANEYFVKHGEEGKNLKVTMVIDRSGSMGGAPTKNSNILVEAFNNLAFTHEELDVQIIYTETNTYYGYSLPVDKINSEKIWAFDRTGSAEGISRTCEAHFARLKESDVNLVYTDGSIMDDALDKNEYKSQEVELVGLYVNEAFSADEISYHIEQNKQYFSKVIIRKTAKDLVNEVSNMLVMEKQR